MDEDAWLAQVQRAEARDRELEGATEGGEAMFLDRPGLDRAPSSRRTYT